MTATGSIPPDQVRGVHVRPDDLADLVAQGAQGRDVVDELERVELSATRTGVHAAARVRHSPTISSQPRRWRSRTRRARRRPASSRSTRTVRRPGSRTS